MTPADPNPDPNADPDAGRGAALRPGDLREWVWGELMRRHAAAYPLPAHGHHPNFRGAADAADPLVDLLLAEGVLRPGARALCYPDYVLRPLRKRLLESGVDVVVPAKYGDGFRLLASGRVPPARAASIAGAERHGEALEAPPALAMTFVACVALDARGVWLSKGYGFTLPVEVRELPSATIVHPLQRLDRLAAGEGRVEYYAVPGLASRVAD